MIADFPGLTGWVSSFHTPKASWVNMLVWFHYWYKVTSDKVTLQISCLGPLVLLLPNL